MVAAAEDAADDVVLDAADAAFNAAMAAIAAAA